MDKFRIERYDSSKAGEWDAFVRASRNATFLFERGYMDYHSDRFADCSWMAYKGSRLVALLPANLTGEGILQSHGGLSYGGWVLPPAHINGEDVIDIFRAALGCWREEGITALDYKPLPHIYASQPSEEDRYALFRLGAAMTECCISSTISLASPGRFNKLQKRHLSKASALQLEIGETDDVEGFMAMLSACLRERHGKAPVHSASELRLLKDRFPDNIRLFAVHCEGAMQAGMCIYDTGLVAHAQYIATTPRGRELNLLTPLVDHLLSRIYTSGYTELAGGLMGPPRRWFDFGISTEDHGSILNEGLLRQKSSYGATATMTVRYLQTLSQAASPGR